MLNLPTLSSDYIVQGAPKTLPKDMNAAEYMINHMREHGTDVALIDSTNGNKTSYNKIIRDAIAIAEALRSRGIQPGDVVGICSENRTEFPATFLATLAIGASCATLNHYNKTGEMRRELSIAQPIIVFCSPTTVTKLDEICPTLKSFKKLIVFGDIKSDDEHESYEELLKTPVDVGNFKFSPVSYEKDIAVIVSSSGTTGLPKCVELTHQNVIAYVDYNIGPQASGVGRTDVLLAQIQFFSGIGWGMLLFALAAKVQVVVMPVFEERKFLENIQKYKITTLLVVPPMVCLLAKHPLSSLYDLSSIRYIGCGAAPLSKELQLLAQQALNCPDIKQGYGMTELTSICALLPPGVNKIGSSGLPAPGMNCKVIDLKTGNALPPYQEGELCFKGPFVMKGYRNNSKATSETIDQDGWLHTGDIAYYDDECYLFVVDRLKELIKCRGIQVAPAELEALLLTHPGVRDAAVIGLPDEEAGELPFAFIVKRPGSNVRGGEIQEFVAEKLSRAKWLHGGVRFVDQIPKNQTGKILRKDLRASLQISKL